MNSVFHFLSSSLVDTYAVGWSSHTLHAFMEKERLKRKFLEVQMDA